MALRSMVNKAHLISPWDDKAPSALHKGLVGLITLDYPVIPGKYHLPGIHSDPEAVARVCCAKVFIPGSSDLEREDHQYAQVIEAPDGKPIVILTVVEARAVMHLAGTMDRDEYGQKLEPPIPRALIPVRPEQLANAIEGDWKHVGIQTIVGETPTMEEVLNARAANFAYKQGVVASTNREFKRYGERAVSIQARRIAWALKQEGKLPTLPEWATINPDAMTSSVRYCPTCSAVLQDSAKLCLACRHIFDWRYAVENGLVPPQNVPPAKREEAGLPPLQPGEIFQPAPTPPFRNQVPKATVPPTRPLGPIEPVNEGIGDDAGTIEKMVEQSASRE